MMKTETRNSTQRTNPRHIQRLFIVSQEEILGFDIRLLVDLIRLPRNTNAWLAFDGYDNDPREIWHIPEVRHYVQFAMTCCPGFVARLALNERRMIRSCIATEQEFDPQTRTATFTPSSFAEWERFARLANIDSME